MLPVGYYSETKLTGAKRLRKGWFGKIILQVEVELIYVIPPHYQRPEEICPPFQFDDGRKTAWRDATPADVGLETVRIDGL
jgi:hypothetical protein